jgi:hypothetical protein
MTRRMGHDERSSRQPIFVSVSYLGPYSSICVRTPVPYLRNPITSKEITRKQIGYEITFKFKMEYFRNMACDPSVSGSKNVSFRQDNQTEHYLDKSQ